MERNDGKRVGPWVNLGRGSDWQPTEQHGDDEQATNSTLGETDDNDADDWLGLTIITGSLAVNSGLLKRQPVSQ